MKAIDYLKRHKGPLVPPKDVEKAMQLHDACPDCGGAGGAPIHPEQPCPGCGFTFADSVGLEDVPRPKPSMTIVGVLASPYNIYRK